MAFLREARIGLLVVRDGKIFVQRVGAFAEAENLVLRYLKVGHGFVTVECCLEIATLIVKIQPCTFGIYQPVFGLAVELGEQGLVSGVKARVLRLLFGGQAGAGSHRIGPGLVDAGIERGIDACRRLALDDLAGAVSRRCTRAVREKGESDNNRFNRLHYGVPDPAVPTAILSGRSSSQ